MRLLRQRTSWIDEANTRIDIVDVLGMLGIQVPVSSNSSKKIHCPFGFYHSDGGFSKAMRVYLTNNTVYCFSCSKRYSSVSLAAASWDCSWLAAAMRLLEDFDLKAKTLAERWEDAVKVEDVTVNVLELSDALKIYCSGLHPEWEIVQLEDDISETLNKCLALVSRVKTEADADKWLHVCKQVMKQKLIGHLL